MGYITVISDFFSGALGKVVAIIVAIVLVIGALAYVINLHSDYTDALADAKQWKEKAEKVDLNVKVVDAQQKQVTTTFEGIDKTAADLLCLAKYGSQVPGGLPIAVSPTEPAIKAVSTYRAATVTKPATTTAPIGPVGLQDQAAISPAKVINDPKISDAIGVSALNNVWKAYCAVTDNVDATCEPFR